MRDTAKISPEPTGRVLVTASLSGFRRLSRNEDGGIFEHMFVHHDSRRAVGRRQLDETDFGNRARWPTGGHFATACSTRLLTSVPGKSQMRTGTGILGWLPRSRYPGPQSLPTKVAARCRTVVGEFVASSDLQFGGTDSLTYSLISCVFDRLPLHLVPMLSGPCTASS